MSEHGPEATTSPPAARPVLHERDEMISAMGAQMRGAPGPARGISIDSRTLEAGDAFFAITGETSDGHDHVEKALAAGAALAVVARDKAGRFAADAPLLIVEDVLAALNDLARAARARSSARIIAVTGSVGKTTTKEALRCALEAEGKPMPPRPPTTITGACRSPSRGCRAAPVSRCSRSA